MNMCRYTSPTDMMMSPVTKGLLARNKKKGAILPPGVGKYQPKVYIYITNIFRFLLIASASACGIANFFYNL